jgi:hypothetical protein
MPSGSQCLRIFDKLILFPSTVRDGFSEAQLGAATEVPSHTRHLKVGSPVV